MIPEFRCRFAMNRLTSSVVRVPFIDIVISYQVVVGFTFGRGTILSRGPRYFYGPHEDLSIGGLTYVARTGFTSSQETPWAQRRLSNLNAATITSSGSRLYE